MTRAAAKAQSDEVIEDLLEAAYSAHLQVQLGREALARNGVSRSHLPDERALMAFALLGDHDRVRIATEVEPSWDLLCEKGLAWGKLAETPTCNLRLLAHALPVINEVESLQSRLKRAADIPAAPERLFKCSNSAESVWGRKMTFRFAAEDCACLIIAPDDVFGFQSRRLEAPPSGHLEGSIDIPCENGSIRFTLLTRGGEVYQHVFHCRTQEFE